MSVTPVKCVMCSKQYIIEGIELMSEINEVTGLERIYYMCPHCGFEYTVALTDEKIRNLMAKRERLRALYKQKPTQKKLARINNLSLDIKQMMDKLNQRAETMK